jgi:transcriptional regulator GlxA family with amidase domain
MYDFTVIVLEGSYASGVSVTLDILAAAAKLAARAGVSAPRWRVCSANGGNVQLSSGIRVATTRLPARYRQDGSMWIIPGLGISERSALENRLEAEDIAFVSNAVAKHVRAGKKVAASCSAVFLLNVAGVLKNRRVTTTWWLAPYLQQLAPECVVDADRMVCVDGLILTGGAALAQTDLMLHVLRDHSGSTLTDWVSRMLLIDGRLAQAPYIVPEALASGDNLVGQIAARIESALPNTISVEELAATFCMSARTLSRHVHRATGKSTTALVQSIKLRKARALLGSSRMSIEQVAQAVGYQDSTALRRMIKKVTGCNPSRFRAAISTP